MCGIAGIVKLRNTETGIVSGILAMNMAIRHRGPDGEGYLAIKENEEIALFGKDTLPDIMASGILQRPLKSVEECGEVSAILAHRRLKIIDVSPTGHQPMCNPDKSLWIVFNGEIYNYVELKEELKKEGYVFHTTSDTEVILAAYTKWGYECVNRFNGMWAFVIYDKRKKAMFASRDRFGVKPFYYVKNENHFAFASEQKALLASSLVGFQPNDKAIFDYWFFSVMESEEEGMFKNITELMPSHSLVLNMDTGELKKWRYYTLPYIERYDEAGFNVQQSTEKIYDLLNSAVKLRLRSDVEVGSCLSGGIDSSSIVSLAHKAGGTTLNTFTVSFNEPEIDESKWANIVAENTRSNAHWVTPKPDELVKDLKSLIYCQDIPIWSTSTYAQYRVMQLIKGTNIKVVLDGQGGDELFAGYENYFMNHLDDELHYHGMSGFMREAKAIGTQYPAYKGYGKQWAINKYVPLLPLSLHLKARLSKHTELAYLKKDFVYENIDRVTLYNERLNTLNTALYKDFSNTLLKSYLKCEDRCSMWHSVESRTPFSDDIKLIEYVFSIPSKYKIQNGQLKYLLRNAMKGTVPQAVLERRDKKGYKTPNRKWIAEIRNNIRHIFEEPTVKEFIDTEKLLKDYEKIFNAPNAPDNNRIFKLIAFPVWLNVFSGKL